MIEIMIDWFIYDRSLHWTHSTAFNFEIPRLLILSYNVSSILTLNFTLYDFYFMNIWKCIQILVTKLIWFLLSSIEPCINFGGQGPLQIISIFINSQQPNVCLNLLVYIEKCWTFLSIHSIINLRFTYLMSMQNYFIQVYLFFLLGLQVLNFI